MREKPRDKERLNHMIEAIDNIFEFVDGKSFDVYKQDKNWNASYLGSWLLSNKG